ncbi:MAG: endonuclease/exonuclease/phosphatase family protein [Oceanipulchritudo sp.]
MKTLRFLLFGLLAGIPGAAGAESEPVRVATWNVRNYLQQNRWHDDAYRFDYPKPEAEKARLRETLLEVRPDILLLQEMGSEAFLLELRDDLRAGGLDYAWFHFSAVPEARTGLALLARFAPDEELLLLPGEAPDEASPGIRRGVHELRFPRGKSVLRVFHVHLKSRYTTDEADPESRAFRTSELRLLEGLVERRRVLAGPREVLLLAGDFNTPFEDGLLDGLRRHWRPLAVEDADGEAWTYHHFKSGRREVIDGFWHPRGQGGAFSPNGVYPAGEVAAGGSDHRMVVIDWRPWSTIREEG